MSIDERIDILLKERSVAKRAIRQQVSQMGGDPADPESKVWIHCQAPLNFPISEQEKLGMRWIIDGRDFPKSFSGYYYPALDKFVLYKKDYQDGKIALDDDGNAQWKVKAELGGSGIDVFGKINAHYNIYLIKSFPIIPSRPSISLHGFDYLKWNPDSKEIERVPVTTVVNNSQNILLDGEIKVSPYYTHIGDYFLDCQGEYFEQGNITPRHFQEWLDSGVNPEIIKLNVESLDGFEVQRLLQSDKIERRNGGAISSSWMKYIARFENGGWWCSGIDPLNDCERMEWGCFKPDSPRTDEERHRIIKYEHPPKVETRAFFLQVSPSIWEKVAERYNVPMPEFPESEQFWQWVIDNKSIPITLTEGAKKAGALLSAGFVAIGLPSHTAGFRKAGFGAISKHVLIPELEIFEGHECFLALDQDKKPKTVALVNSSRSTYGKLFKSLKSPVKVLNWDASEGKGIDDFLVTQGKERIEDIYSSALPFSRWQVQSLFKFTYAPQLQVNSRYLGYGVTKEQIPDDARLVCLKSVKGTGKTQFIADLVRESLRDGKKWVLVITHRTQLGKALADVIGVEYVTELRDPDSFGNIFGYALCFESLHPTSQAQFVAENWGSNGTIILDECEQSLWSLLESSTCDKNRLPILREFSTLIKNVLDENGEGRVVLSDADLSNLSVDLIKKLSGREIQPFVVLNDWKPTEDMRWQVHKYSGANPAQLVRELEGAITRGEKVFICTSGQKASSKWSTQNLEIHLKKLFPAKRIGRIDSETVADPSHPLFGCISQLNQVLQNYDIVIASPTIETGVSIELSKHYPDNPACHFDSVWGIAQGVQSVNSVLQAIARVREPVPRHLWAKERGLNGAFVGNGSVNYRELFVTENQKFQAQIGVLRQAGFELSLEDEADSTDIYFNTWLQMAARHNAGCWSYAESIFEYLSLEGHDIINVEDAESAKEVVEQLTEIRDENYQAKRESVSNRCGFNLESEYQRSKDAREKTIEARENEQKFEIEQRYQIPCNPELIEKDDKGWYPQLRLHYYLILGRQYLPEREKNKIETITKNSDGKLWKPEINKVLLGSKVATYDYLGITEIIRNLGDTFTNSHPLLQEFSKKINDNPKLIRDLKTILGITIKASDKKGKPTTPIERIRPLLTQIGLTLRSTKQKIGGRGEQEVIYHLICSPSQQYKDENGKPIPPPIDDGRQEIFENWLNRDEVRSQEVIQNSELNSESDYAKEMRLKFKNLRYRNPKKRETTSPEPLRLAIADPIPETPVEEPSFIQLNLFSDEAITFDSNDFVSSSDTVVTFCYRSIKKENVTTSKVTTSNVTTDFTTPDLNLEIFSQHNDGEATEVREEPEKEPEPEPEQEQELELQPAPTFPYSGARAIATEKSLGSDRSFIVKLVKEAGAGLWECLEEGAIQPLYRTIRQLLPEPQLGSS